MNGFMFMMKKRKEGILDREPYATFLKKFNKLGDNIVNQKIKWKITSSNKDDHKDGFDLQYIYCERFDLEFEYYLVCDDEIIQNQQFAIVHTLSYKFEDEDGYRDIMYDTVNDIQRRSGSLYISSQVKECEIHATVKGKGVVFITFTVMCDRKVSLQLISNDISLFARNF
jgi:hypothetical protein